MRRCLSLARRIRAIRRNGSTAPCTARLSSSIASALNRIDLSPPQADVVKLPPAKMGDVLWNLRASDESALADASPEGDWDAIVIGGGHNGLTAAAYLAERLQPSGGRSRPRVALVERRSVLGGAALTEEIVEGYLFSRASYVLSLLRPAVVQELGLVEREGLRAHLRAPSSFTPMVGVEGGGAAAAGGSGSGPAGLILGSGDARLDRASLEGLSPSDASRFEEYESMLDRVAAAVGPLLDSPPPMLRELAALPPAWRSVLGLGPAPSGSGSLGQAQEEGALHGSGGGSGRGTSYSEWVEAAKSVSPLARCLARLGPEAPLLYDFLTMPAGRMLDRWFESDALKATLATDAVIGAMTAPSVPGSAYVLLHHVMGEWEGRQGAWTVPEGGMGAVSAALASAARRRGAVLAGGAGLGVESLLFDQVGQGGGQSGDSAGGSRVAGVRLQSGRELRAPLVLSTAAPQTTLGALGGDGQSGPGNNGGSGSNAGAVPDWVRKAATASDSTPASAKINLALRSLPPAPLGRMAAEQAARRAGIPGAGLVAPPSGSRYGSLPLEEACRDGRSPPWLRGTTHFETSVGEIERAYGDAASGNKVSGCPVLELTLPSTLDGTIVPKGVTSGDPEPHVALLFAQYAPYHPEWDDEGVTSAGEGNPWEDEGFRGRFVGRCLEQVDKVLPGFAGEIVGGELLAPPDLERVIGLPQGNIFHSAMGTDQILHNRPAPGLGQYHVPGVAGLFLGGAGSHPGGGVMGAPGRNAALAALDWVRGRPG